MPSLRDSIKTTLNIVYKFVILTGFNKITLNIVYKYVIPMGFNKNRVEYCLQICRSYGAATANQLDFLTLELISLPHCLLPDDDRTPIAHAAANSLKLIQFDHWFLNRIRFLYHEPN